MSPLAGVAVDAVKKLLVSLLVVLMSAAHAIGQQLCDSCNCQISSVRDAQAIYSLSLICNSGAITWFEASGAVRLELTPLHLGTFRTCFLAQTENTHVKISHEGLHKSSESNYRLRLEESRTMKLDHLLTSTAEGREFCMDSKSTDPLLLYIEAVRTPGMEGVPKVVFHYDMEKIDTHIMVDPIEECRPCTKEEMLDSYCSMDFVVIGSMADVSHSDIADLSDITVHVKQVIHQRERHFFKRIKRSDPHLTGHVTVPKKCGMRQGEGDLLLAGRLRLNSLTLRCASYLHEWRKIQHEVECSHN